MRTRGFPQYRNLPYVRWPNAICTNRDQSPAGPWCSSLNFRKSRAAPFFSKFSSVYPMGNAGRIHENQWREHHPQDLFTWFMTLNYGWTLMFAEFVDITPISRGGSADTYFKIHVGFKATNPVVKPWMLRKTSALVANLNLYFQSSYVYVVCMCMYIYIYICKCVYIYIISI